MARRWTSRRGAAGRDVRRIVCASRLSWEQRRVGGRSQRPSRRRRWSRSQVEGNRSLRGSDARSACGVGWLSGSGLSREVERRPGPGVRRAAWRARGRPWLLREWWSAFGRAAAVGDPGARGGRPGACGVWLLLGAEARLGCREAFLEVGSRRVADPRSTRGRTWTKRCPRGAATALSRAAVGSHRVSWSPPAAARGPRGVLAPAAAPPGVAAGVGAPWQVLFGIGRLVPDACRAATPGGFEGWRGSSGSWASAWASRGRAARRRVVGSVAVACWPSSSGGAITRAVVGCEPGRVSGGGVSVAAHRDPRG